MNLSVMSILTVIVLAALAITYRVTTAPDRIRQRLDSARQTCIGTGGRWVKVDREESCQPATEPEPKR